MFCPATYCQKKATPSPDQSLDSNLPDEVDSSNSVLHINEGRSPSLAFLL
jgi:hypothetical protein